MCTHLLSNKWIKLALFISASFLLFQQVLFAQKWEGLGIGDIGLAYFNHLSVDTAQDKLVLGGTYFLVQVNGVSSSSVLKWTPENGVEILSPHNPSVIGVSTIHDVLFTHDSMIVVGDFAIGIYKNGQWVYNYANQDYSFVEIIPYKNHYLVATGYGYFYPLNKPPLLLEWDGDSTFTEFNDITQNTYYSNGVFALSLYQNNLYVGGNGRSSSGSLMNGIMMWDGMNWQESGGGITNVSNLGGVNDMIEYDGDLYIGGMFYQNNHSKENLIARWDGKNWKSVGGGFGWGLGPGSETIDVMAVHGGYLYVAGQFQTPGGIPANSVARWDGHQWCGCGSTFDGQITAMTFYRDTLYVGGGFNHIDGDSIAKIARFIGSDFADTCGSTTVGIKTIETEKTKIVGFPNPAQNEINLLLPNLKNQKIEIYIRNSVGQLVFQKAENILNNKLTLSISSLSNGVYFGEIITLNKNYVYSFIKQ
tara:strand:+ start:100304 stop:101731 length:1428 start_codon:yes stop_codon:yes gene_type:complete